MSKFFLPGEELPDDISDISDDRNSSEEADIIGGGGGGGGSASKKVRLEEPQFGGGPGPSGSGEAEKDLHAGNGGGAAAATDRGAGGGRAEEDPVPSAPPMPLTDEYLPIPREYEDPMTFELMTDPVNLVIIGEENSHTYERKVR